MSKKKLSLGEKIALAASGIQEQDDFPEDVEYETSAKVIDLEDEDYSKFFSSKPVGRSALRTQNDKLLDESDERYSGEKVSRKNFAGSEEDEDNDSLMDGENEEEAEEEEEEVDDEEDDDEGDSLGEEEEDDDEEDDMEVEDEATEDEDEGTSSAAGTLQTLSLRDRQAEIEKGKATLNQIRIWDSLLEVRIRLQKMLIDCNRLPHNNHLFNQLIKNDQDPCSTLSSAFQKSQESTKTLIFELLRLQKIMTLQNSETQKAVSSKRKSTSQLEDDEEEDPEDQNTNPDDDEALILKSPKNAKRMKIEQFSSLASSQFLTFRPFRNQTIQKWNDKTQFASGGKFKKTSGTPQLSTLRQIEQILNSNKEKLLKRTQVKRSTYKIIGEPETLSGIEDSDTQTVAENPEIFDDDDFYHQLLRELIERKTLNVNDPVKLSHHWLELQKLRTKLKKKVDTKASKGRKIRYDVHPKLVNFMAPKYFGASTTGAMTDGAVNELFGSLFGQTKSNNLNDENINTQKELTT